MQHIRVYGTKTPPTQTASLASINHIIVIYQENWSFDSLYGKFPGANGTAGATYAQVDQNGKPYVTLPQPLDTTPETPAPDPRFPSNLPVAPFGASQYVPDNQNLLASLIESCCLYAILPA